MFSNFNTLDLIILAILFVSCFLGFYKGIAQQIIYSISWLAAGYLAHVYGSEVAGILPFKMPFALAQIIAGYMAVFIFVIIVCRLIGLAVSALIRMSGLKLLDQTLGLSYGLIRGLLITMLLVLAVTKIPSLESDGRMSRTSALAPYYLDASVWLKEQFNFSSLLSGLGR